MSNTFLQSDAVRELLSYHCPRFRELPGLDLYMDQVLSVSEEILRPFEDEDKALTSHMINNYVKQKLIPAPVNKKYSRNHLATLILVCFVKKILSFSEIQELFAINGDSRMVEPAYDRFCDLFEMTLQASFMGRTLPTPSGEEENDNLLMAVTVSIVQKIYTQKYIAFLRQQNVNDKDQNARDGKEKK